MTRTYVFVFVGEFGYELLGWQGVVRKFRRLNPAAAVVCASRGHVHPLYAPAEYVDIGDVPEFRASTAAGYFALRADDRQLDSDANVEHDRELRRTLEHAILARLRERWGWRLAARRARGMSFVFSSQRTRLSDCSFGADRRLFGAVQGEGDIYDLIDHRNHLFAPIEPDLAPRAALESRLGFSLDEPYVLVQTRRRPALTRSVAELDEGRIVRALRERARVVLVGFDTGRANDSHSSFDRVDGVHHVELSGFPEQSCLVHHAGACVFATQGDFGSHIYVPALLGREVWAIAPADVYEIGTTPIETWNRHVFRWGGRIHPLRAEELEAPDDLSRFCDDVAGRLPR